MDKCDMCVDRLEAGEQPICVTSCPLSYQIVDLNDIDETQVVADVPGFADSSITGSSTRFILPKGTAVVRG